MSFYTGLSLLSKKALPPGFPKRGEFHALQSREALRVLGLLDRPEDPGEPSLSGREGERPFFADRHGDFNISHSERLIAVSYLAASSRFQGPLLRTGCDAQWVNPQGNHRRVSRRYFHPPEQRYIAAGAGIQEEMRRFYRLWVLKECFLKTLGWPVFAMKGAPVFSLDEEAPVFRRPGRARETGDAPGEPEAAGGLSGDWPPLWFYLYELANPAGEEYALAVSRETPAGGPEGGGPEARREPELRWFSQETLVLRSMAEIKAAERPVKTVKPRI
jgi:hypothetical protein